MVAHRQCRRALMGIPREPAKPRTWEKAPHSGRDRLAGNRATDSTHHQKRRARGAPDVPYRVTSLPRWNKQSPRIVRPGMRLHSTNPSRANWAVTGSAQGVSGK
jgi:hypothetical protein